MQHEISRKKETNLCEELTLWQDHIPAVVLDEVQRLVNGLQHMRYWIGSWTPLDVNAFVSSLDKVTASLESKQEDAQLRFQG